MAKPKEEIDSRAKLIEALGFVAFASSGHDNELYNYIKIKNRLLTASDNTITMGNPVEIDLDMCIQGVKFKAGLQQCKSNFQFTQVDAASISLRSDKFNAVVPIADADTIAETKPDQPIAAIDDRIKKGFDACNDIANEKLDRPFCQCVQLNGNIIVATNGFSAIEYWHGISLPDGLSIPKRATTAIVKSKKPLAAFGFSDTSATFYFDDGSFVKTRLHRAEFPNKSLHALYAHFEGAPFASPPKDFFNGMDAIESFIVDDNVYMHNDYMATNRTLGVGANYLVEGLRGNYQFSFKLWQLIRPHILTVCFHPDPKKPTAFCGPNLRGLIMGKSGFSA